MAAGRGEQYTTRPFAAGALVFDFVTATEEDRTLLESLFRDVPGPGPDGAEPVRCSLLRKDAEGNAWEVGGGRLGHLPPLDLQAALSLLMAEFNFGALDADPAHLHLHAGLVTKGERAVIVAAERNTGKTTTVAHLVARGWSYVTDEMVRVPLGADEVLGVRKPLSIKPGGRDRVEHLQPWFIPPIDVEPDAFRFVPMSASGAIVADGGRPHLVILLRSRVGDDGSGGAVSSPLHPADAVVSMMQETMDAERFGPAAATLASLAAASHTYQLIRGTPEETADEIERLAALDPAPPMDVSVFPSSDAFAGGVVSIGVGDRMVVHDSASGRILALDAGGARVWRQLGGWSDDEIDLGGPVIQPFVEHLRSLGVLTGAA